MIRIEPIKKNTLTIEKDKCIIDDLREDDYIDPDFINTQEKFNYSIDQIMSNNDLSNLINDFDFLIFCLENNKKIANYIFPPEFIQKILLFLTDQANSPEIQVVLKLLKLITAFDSIMQQFLIDNKIFDILFPFLPNDEVIDTFSNLSCKNEKAKTYLLDSNIVGFIIENIKDMDYFDWLIILSRNILFNNGDFSYNQYISQFTQLFHMIFTLLNSDFKEIDDYSITLVVDAFRYYIEADDSFFYDFLKNNYLQFFINLNISSDIKNSYEFLRPLLKICKFIVDKGKKEGAQYLINHNILDIVSKIIFNENQEIRILCFVLLYILVDYDKDITDSLIIHDYHVISVSEFNGESSFRYKTCIFKFCCILLKYASPQYIGELIEESVVNMLVDYPSVLKYESDWIILIEGICRLKEFEDLEIVQLQLKYMKDNEDFRDWIYEASESEISEVADLSMDLISEFFASDNDDQDYDI